MFLSGVGGLIDLQASVIVRPGIGATAGLRLCREGDTRRGPCPVTGKGKQEPFSRRQGPREESGPTSPPGVRPTPEIHGLPPTAEPGEAGISSARGAQGPATRRDETSEAIGRCVGRPTPPPGGARSSPGLRLHRGLSDPGVGSPGKDPRTALHSPCAAEGSPLTPPSPRSCPPHRGLGPSSCLAANGYEITGKRGLRRYNSCRNRGRG